MNAEIIPGVARAAVGHMPFPGHRTVATVWAQEQAAAKRHDPHRRAKEYGFDPDSLKGTRNG